MKSRTVQERAEQLLHVGRKRFVTTQFRSPSSIQACSSPKPTHEPEELAEF